MNRTIKEYFGQEGEGGVWTKIGTMVVGGEKKKKISLEGSIVKQMGGRSEANQNRLGMERGKA